MCSLLQNLANTKAKITFKMGGMCESWMCQSVTRMSEVGINVLHKGKSTFGAYMASWYMSGIETNETM